MIIMCKVTVHDYSIASISHLNTSTIITHHTLHTHTITTITTLHHITLHILKSQRLHFSLSLIGRSIRHLIPRNVQKMVAPSFSVGQFQETSATQVEPNIHPHRPRLGKYLFNLLQSVTLETSMQVGRCCYSITRELTFVSGTASRMNMKNTKEKTAKRSNVPDMWSGELIKTGDTSLMAIKLSQKAALHRDVMTPTKKRTFILKRSQP